MSMVQRVAGDSIVERAATAARNPTPSSTLILEGAEKFPTGGTAAQQRSWLISRYPAWTPYLDHPELGPLLIKAAQADWTQDELSAQIKNTNWYRTNQASQRAWDELGRSDPAEKTRQTNAMIFQIGRQATRLGVDLDPNEVSYLAEGALSMKWSDEELHNAMLSMGTPHPVGTGLVSGTLGANLMSVQALGAKYGIRIDHDTAMKYANDITNLGIPATDIQSMFAAQAKAKYPWMAEMLDQGVVPADFFRESFSVLGDELELPTSTFTLTDPRWSAMLVSVGADGRQRPASETELRTKARKDPSWAKTNNARELMASAGLELMRGLGIPV